MILHVTWKVLTNEDDMVVVDGALKHLGNKTDLKISFGLNTSELNIFVFTFFGN